MLHTWLAMGLIVPVTVSGSSMAPTLSGNRLIVDRTAYSFRSPRRWEVVVFRSPENASELVVKRVVGLPGETVSLVGGDVWINGRKINNPRDTDYDIRYGDRPRFAVENLFAAGTSEPGHRPWPQSRAADSWRLGPTEFFVLGDNAAISDDSRNWLAGGGLDAKLLVGKPLGVQ